MLGWRGAGSRTSGLLSFLSSRSPDNIEVQHMITACQAFETCQNIRTLAAVREVSLAFHLKEDTSFRQFLPTLAVHLGVPVVILAAGSQSF